MITTTPTGIHQLILPQSKKTIEFKYATGQSEIYAELMGLSHATVAEVDASIRPEVDTTPSEEGQPATVVNKVTPQLLKAIRLWVYSAAKYAALIQNKSIEFNEWSPSEWFAEAGPQVFLYPDAEPEPQPAEA